jgi:fibronectin-binding autotransporter adhesin
MTLLALRSALGMDGNPAVTFDAVGPGPAGQGTATVTSITWSHTCSGTNRYVIVGASYGKNPDTGVTMSATFGGTAMTSLGVIHSGGGTTGFVQLWALKNPTVGANTVVVTATTAGDISGGSISFNNVDQTNSAGTPVTASTSSDATSFSANITGTTIGNMVVGVASYGSSVGISASTQTLRYSKALNGNTSSGNNAGATAPANGGTVTIGFSGTSLDAWGLVGVELKAVAPVSTVSLSATTNLTTNGIRSTSGAVSLGATATLTTNGVVADAPAQISGLIHRMRPNNLGLSNGAAVSSVPFETGALTLTSSGGAQPTFVSSGINGRPALRFDGVDDGLTSSAVMTAVAQPITMVAVFVPTNTSRKEEIIHGGGVEMVLSFQNAELWSGSSLVTSSTLSSAAANGVLMEYNGASSAIYINNTLGASGNGGTAGLTAVTMAVGYHPVPGPSRFTGDLYEILIYNRILTSGERTSLANYISSTYQAVAQSGATTLTASSTLSVAGVREQPGAVTLAASATLTSQAQLTEQAAVSLTSTSTLTSNGVRSTDGVVSLASSSTLTANGVNTQTGAVSLSSSASLTSAATRITSGAVSLSAAATLTSAGDRTTSGAATLQAAPTLTAGASLTAQAAVSLMATAGLTSLGIRSVIGASTLTAVPTLSVSGAVSQAGAVSMAATATLTSAADLTTFGAVTLSSTSTLLVGAQLAFSGAVSLLATGVLTGLTGGVNAFGVVSLSALPNLAVSSIRITSASVNLSAAPTLLVSPSQLMVGSVSLVATGLLSVTLGATSGNVNLTVAKTLTVGASLTAVAAVSLTSTYTLTTAGRLDAFGSVILSAVPVLTAGITVRVTNGTALLSALGVLTAGGIGIANATVVPLVSSGSLTVNGSTGSGGGSNLIAASSLLVAGVSVRISATQLTVLSTLTVNGTLVELGAVTLLASAALITNGIVSRLGAALLTTSQSLLATGTRLVVGSVALQAIPVFTFIDLFPEVDMALTGNWDGGGIHADSSPRPKTYLTPQWNSSNSNSLPSIAWSTGGIHVGSTR